ncbi:MAG: phosphotransferase [Calditrichaeota bacterium]|nr:phosphotransferase [Calditrichota bacterium]
MQNSVLTFLRENSQRLRLERFGDLSGYSAVVATPRFKASSHLIFFLLPPGSQQAALVAKVPRIAGSCQLEIETTNLINLQSMGPTGFDSVPRVVSFEEYYGYLMLVETAVSGQTMRPAFVRRNREFCLELGLSWLMDLHRASRTEGDTGQFRALVHAPLTRLEPIARATGQNSLVSRTQELVEEISACSLPFVFEHGDFSSPNLLISDSRSLGVVDWELADKDGLPLVDLFFFLTYIAFASSGAMRPDEYLTAFERAFFDSDAWASSYIKRYVEALKLPEAAVKPLFVLCWGKYVAGLVQRMTNHKAGELTNGQDDRIKWLCTNRYFLLWKHAVENIERLNLTGDL